jgi:PAS domain S-box-containing protein
MLEYSSTAAVVLPRMTTLAPGGILMIDRFHQLDLRGKITAVLITVSLLLGMGVFAIIGIVAYHFVTEHGQDMHIFNFLAPLFAITGMVVIALIFPLARFSARLITTPLLEAVAAAESIAVSGRPTGALSIERHDEFGRLSAAFNIMITRLGESYADLEQRVAERTREYEESQHEAQQAVNLLREAVQYVAVGFTIYDENDRLAICNEAYLRIYEDSRDLIVPGNTFEEIVRKGAERGQYQAAIGNVEAWVDERVRLHQSAKGEIIEQKLGDGRWLMIIEYRTPSGYIVGNRIDITELKNATETLRQRELYLQATLDNLPFLFWLKDADCRFLAVNKVFADACGRSSPDAVVGLTDIDIWPRELAERYRADDLAVMASRREKTIEEPVAGGSATGWIETYKKPVIASDGTLHGTVGFARDISDRREAEARIRDRNQQLDAIFTLSPDGFVSFDREGHVKYASPAFLRMSGFELVSIVGLDEAAFSARLAGACLETARFPGLPALHRHLKVGAGGMKSPEAVTAADAGESPRFLIELADSQKRILEIGLRESGADTVSQILYFRDVTHEKEVERMKSEFLATAAHELRTPMASIYGFTELLLSQEFGEQERGDFLATIFKQSELMVSIINELLDLARIEARRRKDFHIDCLSLNHLVQDVVTGFKPPAGRSSPRVAPCDDPCWVRADPKKLAQAIGNVLSNAYKYSPAGGEVDIEFIIPVPETLDEDGQPTPCGVRITDHGIGMTPEQRTRVFERFYRADTSGKVPGTGLGMSIVKEIIELMDGRIDIASQFGQGSQITLWLPASPPEKTAS